MLFQSTRHQIRQNAGLLRRDVNAGMEDAFPRFLLPEFQEKFRRVVADLKKIRVTAFLYLTSRRTVSAVFVAQG